MTRTRVLAGLLALLAAAPASAQTVTPRAVTPKADTLRADTPAPPVTRSHDATPVPATPPHAYLTPTQKRSALRTRSAVSSRHDRTWASRQRRAVHQERSQYLEGANP